MGDGLVDPSARKAHAMQRSRKRLTVSNLMIAVVACALSIKLGMAYGRSFRYYWEESRFQVKAADSARWYARLVESGDAEPAIKSPVERRRMAALSWSFATDADRKRAKYVRAAFLPWLPTASELP